METPATNGPKTVAFSPGGTTRLVSTTSGRPSTAVNAGHFRSLEKAVASAQAGGGGEETRTNIWSNIFAVNCHALACLRIIISVCLLTEIYREWVPWWRLTGWESTGTMSSEIEDARSLQTSWSVHTISSKYFKTKWALLLSLFQTFGACCLLIGYRTKLASVVSWTLLISLYNANGILLTADHDSLSAALFLLMLIPSGAAWSVDAAIGWQMAGGSVPLVGRRIVSPATFFLFLHTLSITLASGLAKTGDAWERTGVAVYSVLRYPAMGECSSLFASSMWLTYYAAQLIPCLQIYCPLLILVASLPIFGFAGDCIRHLVVITMSAMYFVAATCMHGVSGISYVITAAFWLALSPSYFSPRTHRKSRDRLELRYIPADGVGAVPPMTLSIFATIFALDHTAIAPADAPIMVCLQREAMTWGAIDPVDSSSHSNAAVAKKLVVVDLPHFFVLLLSASPFLTPFKFILKPMLTLSWVQTAIALLWSLTAFRGPGASDRIGTSQTAERICKVWAMGRTSLVVSTAWRKGASSQRSRPMLIQSGYALFAVGLVSFAIVLAWINLASNTQLQLPDSIVDVMTSLRLSAPASKWATGPPRLFSTLIFQAQSHGLDETKRNCIVTTASFCGTLVCAPNVTLDNLSDSNVMDFGFGSSRLHRALASHFAHSNSFNQVSVVLLYHLLHNVCASLRSTSFDVDNVRVAILGLEREATWKREPHTARLEWIYELSCASNKFQNL